MLKNHENMQYALFATLCVNSLIYSTNTTITVAVSHSICLLPSSQMLSWAIQGETRGKVRYTARHQGLRDR